MTKQLLVYVPVIQRGYEEFLSNHQDADEVLVVGTGFADEFDWMRKELRALDPYRVVIYLKELFWPFLKNFTVVEPDDLARHVSADELVLPDEDLSHQLVERYQLAAGRNITYDPTFLRWERRNATAEVMVASDEVISRHEFDRRMMSLARREAVGSVDWWRQVGAVLVLADHTLLSERNRHLPSDYGPLVSGDPRGAFRRSDHIELSTAIHAESALIAECARAGLVTDNAMLYVTTFPCPVCAKLIAAAGIATCFYTGGYAMLDGVEVLRAADVGIVRVDDEPPPD